MTAHIEMQGRVWKKRGGFWGHRWAHWTQREFEIGSDGTLVKQRRGRKVGRIELARANVWTAAGRLHGSPTPYVIVVSQGQRRWELCFNSAGEQAAWTKQLAKFSRDKEDDVVERKKVDKVNVRHVVTKKKTPSKGKAKSGWRFGAVILMRERNRIASAFAVATTITLATKLFDAHVVLELLCAMAALWYVKNRQTTQPDSTVSEAAESRFSMNVRGVGLKRDETADRSPMTWSTSPADAFRLRQVGYNHKRHKAPSSEAFYRVVYAQVFDTNQRIEAIADVLDLAEPTFISPDPDVPSLFIVDAQLPSTVGSLRVHEDANGPGHQIVTVMTLTENARDELAVLDHLHTARANALRLFREWCRHAVDDPAVKGRFKVVAQIKNADALPTFAKKYNGKPALISKTGKLRRGRTKDGHSFLEMAVNVHAFGYLARLGFHSLYNQFNSYVVSAGFTIEGRNDDELPENLLGAFDLNYIS